MYCQAETYRRRLVTAYPKNVEYARTLANTVMNLGTLKILLGYNDRGLTRWQDDLIE